MRDLSQFSPTLNRPLQTPRRASKGMALALSMSWGVSVLALGANIATPNTAWAQGDFAVDITQPGISVDMSVLNDGGLSPQTGAPMPAATSGAISGGRYKAPGVNAPVSQLYVQPSGDVNLPPQTKALIARPAPRVEPDYAAPDDMTADMADDEAVNDVAHDTPPTPETAPEPVDVAMPPAADVVPPAAEVALPEAPADAEPAATEPADEAAPEVAKAEPTPDVTPDDVTPDVAPAATPEPAPVAAAEPAPVPAPEPTPATQETAAIEQPITEPPVTEQPVNEQAAAQTPPPPPQALTQAQVQAQAQAQAQAPNTPPVDSAPTPTAQNSAKSAVVVDLPPKLEENHPGVASLPPASGPLTDGDSMRLVFDNDSSKLPADTRDALKALADRMAQQDTLRLQLLAYAGDTETSASAARRLSLSRALAVRSFLIENGVRSTRIDVRALGNKSTEPVTERVDITVVER